MKKHSFLCILTLTLSTSAWSQFTLDGQFRPRTEYRHGFGSIIPDEADAGYAISTRIRLNTGYTFDSYAFFISLQDVMVWGENRQLLPDDENNSFAVFEAWANLKLGKGWSTKLGRQVISYDDQRIFGGLDWAQQGRNHDAGLLKYKSEKFMMMSAWPSVKISTTRPGFNPLVPHTILPVFSATRPCNTCMRNKNGTVFREAFCY